MKPYESSLAKEQPKEGKKTPNTVRSQTLHLSWINLAKTDLAYPYSEASSLSES